MTPPAASVDRTFWLDDELVRGFLAGQLDAADEERLAAGVASLVFADKTLPNHTVGHLSHIQARLGGPDAVLRWLAGFPGRPRLVARLAMLGDMLDLLSDDPHAVAALTELRAQTPYPHGTAGYLVEDTDETTLGSLAHVVESIAADGRLDEAGRLALGTVSLLEDVVARAGGRSTTVDGVGKALPALRHDLLDAIGDGAAVRV